MSNQAAVQLMADNAMKLLNENDRLMAQNAQNLAFLKQVITGWKDGTLTADRIKVMENGDYRILDPEPPDVPPILTDKLPVCGQCKEQTPIDTLFLPATGGALLCKKCFTPPSSNGKEETAETSPLADLQEGDKIKPKVEVGSNGDADN